jgi:hypothetical protein
MANATSSAIGGAASGAAAGATVGGPWGAAIGGVAGGLIGGIGGYFAGAAAEKDEKARKKLLQEGIARIQAIPDPEMQKAAYGELKSQGIITPKLEQEIQIADTEMLGVQVDPRLREAQMTALGQLQELGTSGGMDAADLANIERAKQRAAAMSASQQAGIQESLARRGVGGSGLELAQRQMAAQQAANALRQQEMDVQGEARRRALQAVMQGGALAGDVRSQQFSEEARKAEAADLVNRFREQNMIGTQQRNIDRKNVAQAANLKEEQRLSEANVGLRNAEQDADWQRRQQIFNSRLSKAQAAAGQGSNLANYYGDQAQATRDMWGGLLKGVGQGAAAYQQQKNFDKLYGNKSPTIDENTEMSEYVPISKRGSTYG